MKFNILKDSKEEIVFVMGETDCVLANTLRRIMISEIPTFAIEYIKFFVNNTVMPEEIICNRLGLIPFKLERRMLKYVKAEENKMSEKSFNETNSLHFELHKNIEKTAIPGSLTVFSEDIKFDGATPVYENLPIVKLTGKQCLSLEGYGTMGLGKVHTKWSAVGTAFYEEAENGFKFTIQTNGQYTNKEIFRAANLVLIAKLKIIKENLCKMDEINNTEDTEEDN